MAELIVQVSDLEGIAIDIPIGLPDRGRRAADLLARQVLGPRLNSVFFTPVRAALAAPTHAEATHLSHQLTGAGISQQAWSLGRKVFDVEAWLPNAPAPVWEIHPEVSFATLASRPLEDPKTCWSGAWERYLLLQSAGIVLNHRVKEAGRKVEVDDMLDAAAAAWSARRVVTGKAISYPNPPEEGETGRTVAIWA